MNEPPVCANKSCNNLVDLKTKRGGWRKCCSNRCFGQHIRGDQEKRERTNIERYGFKNPAQNSNVLDKRTETMLFRYRVEHALQNTTIQQAYQQTITDRYGSLSAEIIRQRKEESCLNKYGTNHQSQSPDVKKNKKNTFFKELRSRTSFPRSYHSRKAGQDRLYQ